MKVKLKTSEDVDQRINALTISSTFGEMNMQSLQDMPTQVKLQETKQEQLTNALTKAIGSKATKATIEVAGQKFSFEFKQGAWGEKNGYIVRTSYRPQAEPVSVNSTGTGYKAYGTLDGFLKANAKYSTRSIVSGVVLEVEYSPTSRLATNTVTVAGWAQVVELYVAKVAKELNWN